MFRQKEIEEAFDRMDDSDDESLRRNHDVLKRKLQSKKTKRTTSKLYDKIKKKNHRDYISSPKKANPIEFDNVSSKKGSEYKYSTFK